MHRLHGSFVPFTGRVTTAESYVEPWHKRFGHAGHDEITKLAHNAVTGMHKIQARDQYDACVQAKQTRSSFARSSPQAQYPLFLLHSDSVGPIRVEGLKRETYFVNLFDDFLDTVSCSV
jgi:hypothetical protein